MARGNKSPVRMYVVTDCDGGVHDVEASYAFDNSDEGRGLTFRRHIDDNPSSKTYVVAEFSAGSWKFYKEKAQNNG